MIEQWQFAVATMGLAATIIGCSFYLGNRLGRMEAKIDVMWSRLFGEGKRT